MARALASGALLFVLATLAAPACAQDAGTRGPEVHVVRPPEGSLRRGRYAVPDWAVYAAGGALAATAIGILVFRSLGRRR